MSLRKGKELENVVTGINPRRGGKVSHYPRLFCSFGVSHVLLLLHGVSTPHPDTPGIHSVYQRHLGARECRNRRSPKFLFTNYTE